MSPVMSARSEEFISSITWGHVVGARIFLSCSGREGEQPEWALNLERTLVSFRSRTSA